MHNFISWQAVEKAGLKLIKQLSFVVVLINGTKLPITGIYHKTLHITHRNKETRLKAVTLRCVDLHRVQYSTRDALDHDGKASFSLGELAMDVQVGR